MTKKYSSNEMQKWLFEKAQAASDPVRARKIITSNELRGRPGIRTGRVYFFKYDPKGKYTLPQYDKFPLCIPIERYQDGFLGLNLHYLSVHQRSSFLKLLMEKRSENIITDRTVMKIDYDILMAVSKLQRYTKASVHRYLYTHVRSKFIEVYPSEYDIAIQLPVDNWVFNI